MASASIPMAAQGSAGVRGQNVSSQSVAPGTSVWPPYRGCTLRSRRRQSSATVQALSKPGQLVKPPRRERGRFDRYSFDEGGERKGGSVVKLDLDSTTTDSATMLAWAVTLVQTLDEAASSVDGLDVPADELVAYINQTDEAMMKAQGRAQSYVGTLDMEAIGVSALLIVVQLTFSIWYAMGKSALEDGVDPLSFALVREILSSLLLWAAAFKLEGNFKLQQPGDDRKFLILGGLCCLNVCGFITGLKYVSELQASIMQPFVPVMVMGLCAGMGIEQLTARSKAGVLLSSAGAIGATVAACAGDGAAGATSVDGNLVFGSGILLAQITGYSLLMINQRELSTRYPPLQMTAVYYTIGSLLTILLEAGSQGFDMSHVISSLAVFGAPWNTKLWGALWFAVIMASVFTYSSMTYASSKVSPNTVSVYSALQPLFSLGIGLAVFHNEVNVAEVGSGALIIGGLLLATSSSPSEETQN